MKVDPERTTTVSTSERASLTTFSSFDSYGFARGGRSYEAAIKNRSRQDVCRALECD